MTDTTSVPTDSVGTPIIDSTGAPAYGVDGLPLVAAPRATRAIHRFKLQPDSDGVATVTVPAHAPRLLSVEVDLSGDLSAFVEVTIDPAVALSDLGLDPFAFRFAVVGTGAPIPDGGMYLGTRVLLTAFGPKIVHVYRLGA